MLCPKCQRMILSGDYMVLAYLLGFENTLQAQFICRFCAKAVVRCDRCGIVDLNSIVKLNDWGIICRPCKSVYEHFDSKWGGWA